MRFRSFLLVLTWVLAVLGVPTTQADGVRAGEPRVEDTRWLFRGVTATEKWIVFACAGQLWKVAPEGGEAIALTEGLDGEDRYPLASPDGRWIAFSRTSGGNEDVWLLPAPGGADASEARRLTYNPKSDRVRGWTPDSERILFASGRDGDGLARLYTIGREEAFPEALPLPRGEFGAYSPDGQRLAYAPVDLGTEEREYRYYRGGQTSPLWIATLETSEVEVLAEPTSNHRFPMWRGDTLYYLNDAGGTFNLVAHPLGGEPKPLTAFEGFGIRSASLVSRGKEIVFVRAGQLHVHDLDGGQTRKLSVQLQPPTDERAAKQVPLADWVDSVLPMPGSQDLLVAARGDLLRFDPVHGTAVNLTASSNAADREPVVSPDGRRLAYVSDRSGEYQLHVRELDSDGTAETVLPIESEPSFYRQPVFSPDGRYLAFSGKRLGLWLADLEAGTVSLIDRGLALEQELWQPSFSPDGRYLAYAKALVTHQRTIFLYDIERGYSRRATPNTVHAERPVFDPNGKYLYFLTSHNAPIAIGTDIWGQLSAELMAPHILFRVEAAVLRAGDPPPLLPSAQPHPDVAMDELRVTTQVDFDGLDQRIVELPLRPRAYQELAVGAPGVLFLRYREWPEAPGAGGASKTPLYRYDLNTGGFDPLAEDVDSFSLSIQRSEAAGDADVLYQAGNRWWRRSATVSEGTLTVSPASPIEWGTAQIDVDPVAEWRQIYREAWRLMRDFFYDPGHHGRDLDALAAHFADYLAGVTRRADLDFLLAEMLGQVSISHMSIRPGDQAPPVGEWERIGLLGGRFELVRGEDGVHRYQLVDIYESGQSVRTSSLVRTAPLAQPGVDAREGDYLLAIDGETLDGSTNLYAALRGTLYRLITLRLGPTPDGEGAREVSVMPIAGENGLQRAAWFEANRQRVEARSNGRLGYIAVADYGRGAIEEFLGQLASQADRDGLIIDQRFNPGGITADTLVQMLTHVPLHRYAFPHGRDLSVPTTLARGPKVLLINEHNGSAGETFPLMFQLARAGTVVGKRTSGGGTGGALHYPRLIDGGRITIPNRAAYDPRTGRWAENDGVHPDIEVENWPADWRRGHDAQLETAIDLALSQADTAPRRSAERPAYPVHPE